MLQLLHPAMFLAMCHHPKHFEMNPCLRTNAEINMLRLQFNSSKGLCWSEWQCPRTIRYRDLGTSCEIRAKSVPNNTDAGSSAGQPDPTTTVVVTSIDHGASAAFTLTVNYIQQT